MPLTRRNFLQSTGAALALSGRAEAAGAQAQTGRAFAGWWRAVAGTGAPPDRVAAIIQAVTAEVDAAMSPYRTDAALARFNRSRTLDWQPVPPDLARLAAEALALTDETGGAFDPTIGPLVRRYGFGPIEGRHAGADALEVAPGRLRKTDPAATLDLNAIAKGAALDLITGRLAEAGITDFLIELGGEIRARGRHPDGRAWRIAVEDPRPGGGAVRVLDPRGRAVATSGHARQGFSGAAGAVSHLIDPRTGRPADMRLASVTVLDARAARADALATALVVMGPEAAPDFAARTGIDALFLIADGTGLREVASGSIETHLVD